MFGLVGLLGEPRSHPEKIGWNRVPELIQDLFISRRIETDHQLFADNQCRSSQVSGWSQHQLLDLFVAKGLFFQINLDNILALGRVQTIRSGQKLFSFFELVGFLFGIGFGLGLNAFLCKKLLRFYTGLSAGAMVAPVDVFHCTAPEDWVEKADYLFASLASKAICRVRHAMHARVAERSLH